MRQECGILFGDMMKAGAFPNLERLCMSEQLIYRSVWEALEVWSCPKLKELELSIAEFTCDSTGALVSALHSGALSNLQHIDINLPGVHLAWDSGGNDDDGGGSIPPVVNRLNAMASSWCPDLRYLIWGAGRRGG